MSFNEESARKIINFLLEEDAYEFRRWLPKIKEFNSEQIQNLFGGKIDYEYPIKNKKVFEKLVQKFDNFEVLISNWYLKEEYHKYLKQLWLQYICIESITENLENEKNDEKLTNYLEQNKVNYSQWPNEVKEDFRKCWKATCGTQIHEEEIKKKINEEHSIYKKIFNTMNETIESFKNLFKDINEESQKIFESGYCPVIKTVVLGIVSLAGLATCCKGYEGINHKLTKKSILKQIKNYVPGLKNVKKVAKDIMNNYFGSGITNIVWRISTLTETLDLDSDDEEISGKTCLKGWNEGDLDINIDLSGKENETLSIMEKLSTVFKNNMVCGLVAFASVTNLCYSVYEYNEIKNIIKSIKVQKKEYREKFEKIKESYRQHLQELDIDNCNPREILLQISYVRNNIVDDKNRLVKLLEEIEADIKLLEQKKKDSFYGLISSAVFGGASILGSISTCGLSSGIYLACTLFNVVSGAVNCNSMSDCSKAIVELEKLKSEIESENKLMDEQLEKLNLILKQKDVPPNRFEEFDDLYQKQNKKLKQLNKDFL